MELSNEPDFTVEPPEILLSCGFCGFTRKKSEYNHTCWGAIALGCVLGLIPIQLFVLLILNLLGWI